MKWYAAYISNLGAPYFAWVAVNFFCCRRKWAETSLPWRTLPLVQKYSNRHCASVSVQHEIAFRVWLCFNVASMSAFFISLKAFCCSDPHVLANSAPTSKNHIGGLQIVPTFRLRCSSTSKKY